ncbi:MAG: hypothetical protein Q7U10_00155 [Thermodesulfovibrionia bacterium]|nr:hypothetical protein [Thermodesulfovibrionia bacterium]
MISNFRKICSIAVITAFLLISYNGKAFATDWQSVSDALIRSFEGKIVSIKQIDSKECHAVLSPATSGDQAVKLAEDIGDFLNNYTGGHSGEKPVVYVIVKDKEIAAARFSRMKYIGKLQ